MKLLRVSVAVETYVLVEDDAREADVALAAAEALEDNFREHGIEGADSIEIVEALDDVPDGDRDVIPWGGGDDYATVREFFTRGEQT